MDAMSDSALQRVRRLANTPYQVDRVRAALEHLGQRLEVLEARERTRTAELQAAVQIEGLRLRAALRDARPRPAPAMLDERVDLAEGLRRLEPRAPAAFRLWAPALQVNEAAYHVDPTHNCSVDGHLVAETFRLFVRAHVSGAVLDVGCGPQAVPAYLRGYRLDCVAGVDPLPPMAPHPFMFHQGVAEYLPWADRSIDTVVVATSLDHVLLLEESLDELSRVLTDDGKLVLWVGLVPGAKRYDPRAPDVAKIDDFHLFHFDEPWLMEVLRGRFFVGERLAPAPGESSVFYALEKEHLR